MSNQLHKHLLSIVSRLPSDFEPWGTRDRDIDKPCDDCSCGCRWFITLETEIGADWGVCTNPRSPRCALLTFEHQGCPDFEFDTSLDESGETPQS